MSIHYSPTTVTNGLVLSLDAGNSKSYPGGGTTWTDLSGNGNTGTLVNGPTYSSANGGSIVFAGSYVDAGNAASLQLSVGTINAWIKTSNAGASYRGIVAKQSAYSMFLYDNVFILYDWGSSQKSTGVNLADGLWHYVAASFQSGVTNGTVLYIDGVIALTTAMYVTGQSVSVQIAEANHGQLFNGLISSVSIYNRALSAAEIYQNFNALRGRYGV